MSNEQHVRNTGLPPQPFQGDLAGVPRRYQHAKCQHETEMPEEVIRAYVADPFFFVHGTRVWCDGCAKHVSIRDVEWVGTGQRVAAYIDELRNQTVQPGGVNYQPADPLGIGALLVLLAAPFGGFAGAGWPGGIAGCVVGAAAVGGWKLHRNRHPLAMPTSRQMPRSAGTSPGDSNAQLD